MPTIDRRENKLIKLFLSAYENDTWKDSDLRWLDQEEDSAVEVLATRKNDGLTLAIEHTLIQPYPKYRQDLARLEQSGLSAIQNDSTLVVPGSRLVVFLAAGELKRGRDWRGVRTAVHDWVRANLKLILEGDSNHIIVTPDGLGCKILVRAKRIPNFGGSVHVGVDGAHLPSDSLLTVVKKALDTKLDKLRRTDANRRILLLERSELTLAEVQIVRLIEQLRSSYDGLSAVDEIWFADTVFSDESACFWLYDGVGDLAASLEFQQGNLATRSVALSRPVSGLARSL